MLGNRFDDVLFILVHYRYAYVHCTPTVNTQLHNTSERSVVSLNIRAGRADTLN